MERILSQINTIRKHKLGKILLLFFSVSLFLPMLVTNLLSIFLFFFIIYNLRKIPIKKGDGRSVVFPFLSIYLIIFLGFFYNIDFDNVVIDLEKKLSLIIIPISIVIIGVTEKEFKIFLKAFFYTGVLFTSCSFLISLYDFFASAGDYKLITHHGLSMNIGFHATYLSMYLLFSLSFPLFYFKFITKGRERILVLLSAFLVVVFIMFLSSRIIWLILFISIVAFVLKLIIAGKITLKYYVISFFGIIFISSIFLIKPIKERVLEAINYNNEYSTSKVWGGRGIRLLIWENSKELISSKPLFGYGSSTDVQTQLNKQYKINKAGPLLFMMKQNKAFNAHNQYLEELLKHGYIFGCTYALMLLFFLINFFNKKIWIGVFLIGIIISTSVTETIFELNKGIIFITFFIPLVYFAHIHKKL